MLMVSTRDVVNVIIFWFVGDICGIFQLLATACLSLEEQNIIGLDSDALFD